MTRKIVAQFLLLLFLAGTSIAFGNEASKLSAIDSKLIASGSDTGNWLSHGRTYDEQRFSPLSNINEANVSSLGLAWSFDTDYNRGLEATPIVVDGVIYVTGVWSVVYALNARDGKLIWKYDPEVPKAWGANACCDVVNRGLAIWKGALLLGTLDGRLVSIDALTGQKRWETMTIDQKYPYTITGAPRIINDKVIIGNGGAEFGVRGYVSAYDTETGKMIWRFFTVPGNPDKEFENPALEMAAKTWSGEWWLRSGGGGTVYDAMAYDPELNLLYIGVGNGGPYDPDQRSPGGGDNLFLSSVVALNADTGEYRWHYQTTPGDAWDYTATQSIVLADIQLKGKTRKVLMQAPKNGFFYVLDRATGELLSAKPFARINWASHVDMKTGRPVINESALYWKENKTGMVRPGPIGAHNWQPMAYNPQTGLVYIPVIDNMLDYKASEEKTHRPPNKGFGVLDMGLDLTSTPEGDPLFVERLVKYGTAGNLTAWNPVSQEIAWKVQMPLAWNGGVLTTGGNLVFQGTADGRFVAYNAATGEALWESIAYSSVMAAPVTYTVDGEQYVTVLAGKGGAFPLATSIGNLTPRPEHGRVLTYKLNGTATLPPPPALKKISYNPAWENFDDSKVDAGRKLYGNYCARCHGVRVVSSGDIPDLRYMSQSMHVIFDKIVIDGVLAQNGMIGFGKALSVDDVDAIRNYLIYESKLAYNNDQLPSWWLTIKIWFYECAGKAIRYFIVD